MLIFEPNVLRNMFGSDYNQVSVIPIDVTQAETHSFGHTITKKPVQDGATIADNILIEPDRVTITGIFTDRSILRDGLDLVDGLLNDGLAPTEFTTWEDKLSKLHEIRKLREPFTLVTSLGTYKNMFFDGDITVNRDLTSTNALFFTATLVGINIIASRTTQVPASALGETASTEEKNGGAKNMAPAKDVGKQSNTAGQVNAAGQKVGAATPEKSKSWLLQGGEWGVEKVKGWVN